jgi:hypothetical protein
VALFVGVISVTLAGGDNMPVPEIVFTISVSESLRVIETATVLLPILVGKKDTVNVLLAPGFKIIDILFKVVVLSNFVGK